MIEELSLPRKEYESSEEFKHRAREISLMKLLCSYDNTTMSDLRFNMEDGRIISAVITLS